MPRSSHREHRTADKRNHRVQSPGTIRNDQNAGRVAHGSSPLNHLVAACVAGNPISNGTPPKIQHRCRRHQFRHHSARSTAVEPKCARASLRESSSQEVVQQQPRSPAGEVRIIGHEKRAGGRPQLMMAGFILLLHRAWIARRQHGAFNDVVYCFYRLLLSNSFAAARRSEDAMRHGLIVVPSVDAGICRARGSARPPGALFAVQLA